MIPTHPPTFSINYGAFHSRCGKTLKKSDFRIHSYESLNLIARQDGSYQPLQIYCNHCQETVNATTVDAWMFVNLSAQEIFYEVPIEELSNLHSKLESEHEKGLRISR